jgi:hypothetical protein
MLRTLKDAVVAFIREGADRLASMRGMARSRSRQRTWEDVPPVAGVGYVAPVNRHFVQALNDDQALVERLRAAALMHGQKWGEVTWEAELFDKAADVLERLLREAEEVERSA